MKIAVIGAGHVGRALGEKWAAAGHEVIYGVRQPADPLAKELNGKAAVRGRTSPIAEAVRRGEVVALAIPGAAVAGFATEFGAALAGKTVIDAANNVRAEVMHNLGTLAELAPGAVLARAFNSLGWEVFENPVLGGQRADHFFCADPSARALLEGLISEVGLRPVYVGGMELAPALDGLTRLYFALSAGQGKGRRIGLKLLEDRLP